MPRSRTKSPALESWTVREAAIHYRAITDVDGVPFSGVGEIKSSRQVIPIFQRWIGAGTVERVGILAISSANVPIAAAIVGQGTARGSMVSRAEIARFLALTGATGLIVGHNHPSGNASPSDDDIEMTRNLAKLCALLEVTLLDHVIVTPDATFSFADRGMVPK